ncbi:uncharacterized protein DUF4386 [Tenacibaculum skagerrakense]|uniref:Uncharacterized protein DUF4386 n=1 Tax=Tenacibaculum skagerrakense TaxID=186571 RepID=A0A4R2NX93_9FLAO|nr:DUF4386 domain-containing protein [Tenacibaculum skagerrakense]TCP26803.1 uncharacterized protein DUF4386 [Tenacibaculum skagerrakense]
MKSNQKTARIVGVLFLFIFFIGVTVYQVLQAPLLSDDVLKETATHQNQLISSTLLNMLSGILSISIAVLLFPVFKVNSTNLARLYFAFTLLNFIAIVIDNGSVFSLLELSKVSSDIKNIETLNALQKIFSEKHWWTHYFSLLTSCFPVFVLYYTLFVAKLVPKLISLIGIIASILMFVEMLSSIFGHGISMNLMLPMAFIQLLLPIWLIIKGFKENIIINNH